MSSFGDKTIESGANSNGTEVRFEGENLKFISNWMSAIFVCIKPNLNPTQFLGPSPALN